jgi:uncharacterized protein (DUF885 family)
VRALLCLLALSACATPAAAPKADDAPRRLHALFEETWQRELDVSPIEATYFGDLRNASRWDEVGLAAQDARSKEHEGVLAKLAAIPRTLLSTEDAISYDLFKHRHEEAVLDHRWRLYLLPIQPRSGIQTIADIADVIPFKTTRAYEDYNRRLVSFPQYMDETIELLTEGARTGIVQPKVVMERVTAQIEKHIVDDAAKSPFFAPYQKASAIPPEARERFASEAKRAIAEKVVPAFQKLRTFWTTTYLPACKDEIGAWQLPEGRERYAYLVRKHTTTRLTPEEVHAIGLREVARIRSAMEAEKARAAFKGTLREMFEYMRTDAQFFYSDGAELLVAYRDLAKRIDPLLAPLFKRLPRTPYGVAPIPDAIAPDTTTAYYRGPAADGSRAGTYFVNLYQPKSRPKWEMTALTLHEAVPGHHLQVALAQEQDNLPSFRRYHGYTAFVEGWALYAESLGQEMGVYDDPWAKMGQLTYEMWRAVRLVVDTGIHALKWDRRRAIDFFIENAPKTELDIVNEVDRYIAWPGQALAYKIGELRIQELRKKRREALGERFNLAAFHDAVLRHGPLPLDLLEREVLAEK